MNKLFIKNKNKVASVDVVPSDATVLLGCYNYVPLEEFLSKHSECEVPKLCNLDIAKILRF